MASNYITRKRRFRPRVIRGKTTRYDSSGGIVATFETDASDRVTGTQITVSRGNPWPPRKSGFQGDVGGDFMSTATYAQGSFPKQRIQLPGGAGYSRAEFVGNLVTAPNVGSNNGVPGPINSSDDDLDEMGATAVARCTPTNSIADVSVFLGELMHEGLPRVQASRDWQRATTAARAAGDDYLNAAFGWRPLLNDVSNIVEAVGSTSAKLAQLKRDSGRLVRRRYEFPTEYTSHVDKGLSAPLQLGFIGASQNSAFDVFGTRERLVETERRRWFSGAFTYHIPEDLLGSSEIDRIRAEAELGFGLSLTPETFWNLAPWSWAIDWFSNTGDVIANISAFNRYGLIMPYGYMMEHTINKYTYSSPGSRLRGLKIGPPDLILICETKKRRKANPFGFGVQWSGLNPFQLSILSALGLSRS